jgi:hypothetical protein
VAAGFSIDFTATATLSDGTPHIGLEDGSEGDWTIVSQPGTNATIDTNTGIITTGVDSEGEITVQIKGTTAAWAGTVEKTITVTDGPFVLAICGGLNDTSQTYILGYCLKVAADDAGMLFTGSPSLAVMRALEYTYAPGARKTNDGKTYAAKYSGNGMAAPAGTFTLFDQQILGGNNTSSFAAAGVGGQYDRWCKNLGDMSFNGRTDWRRASKTELKGLYSDRGNMYIGYGWSVQNGYWSSTMAGGGKFVFVMLNGKGTGTVKAWGLVNVSCVSAP